MMKRFIALLLGIALVFGTVSVPAMAAGAFVDVPANAWYNASVSYAIGERLFFGVDQTHFAPNSQMTRAMLVAVLWRHAGRPIEKGNVEFLDVPEGAWYADAVSWASANSIVHGNVAPSETADGNDIYYGEFYPNRAITRQELAAVLARYARYIGLPVSGNGTAALSQFPDARNIADWALQDMQWCVENGYISGSRTSNGTYLYARYPATRAQVATVLMRFCLSLDKII